MRIVLIVLGLCAFVTGNAQNSLEEVLGAIESNNLTLKTLRMEMDAVKVRNKVGLNPSNPEVEYVHQWGKEESMGSRTELNVVQSFDFPTAYVYRGKIANALNDKAEMDYKGAYNDVMLNALQLCYRMIYGHLLITEYQKRLEHAKSIAEAFKYKLETGDVNIIESNKAQLNLLNARNNLATLQAQQEAVKQRLQGVNGGLPLDLSNLLVVNASLPSDFDAWFESMIPIMPEVLSLQKGLNASRKTEQLNKALSLPKLAGGYSSEKGLTDDFKGLNVGVTIPLWENRNTVKQVKLQSLAMENHIEDVRLRAYHGLKGLYDKAYRLKQTIDDYQLVLDNMNSDELLKIALDSGEISVLDFIVEQAIYYEAIENYVAVQLEYNNTLARLNYFDYE